MESKLKERKGITLIALIITIIVLLILAGVSIAMLTGENGILTKVNNAKEKTEKASAEEKVKLAVLGSYDNNGDLSLDKLKKEVKNEGGTVTGDTFPVTVTMDGYDFTVDANGVISDKGTDGGGNTPSGEEISKSESYVGYYADTDGDKEADGIIYADLAVGGSGTWNSYISYSYSAETGLKDYYISKTGYEGKFGTKDVLTSTGTGKDRFYVMALEDFNPGTAYYWYNSAYGKGKLDNLVGESTNDFRQGKTNTTTMIAEWNKGENGKYGAQNAQDMWGVIQKADSAGKIWDLSKWFVPSKAEWATFGDFLSTELGVTTGNYGKYGLYYQYWSSAQFDTDSAYSANFYDGSIYKSSVSLGFSVRLSATF